MPEPDGVTAWIDRYNRSIRQVAAQHKIVLADVSCWWDEALQKGNKLTDLLRTKENSGIADGVHPTKRGQRLFADCIADSILPFVD